MTVELLAFLQRYVEPTTVRDAHLLDVDYRTVGKSQEVVEWISDGLAQSRPVADCSGLDLASADSAVDQSLHARLRDGAMVAGYSDSLPPRKRGAERTPAPRAISRVSTRRRSDDCRSAWSASSRRCCTCIRRSR